MSFSISVLIPVYNRQESLLRAVDSVLRQTLVPDEIIVADDASNFSVKEFLLTERPLVTDRIKVVRTSSNKGVSGARNLAFQHSAGSLIALLDSDDYWQPDKLEKQLAVFAQNPAVDIVSCQQYMVNKDKIANHNKKLIQENLFDQLINDWHPPNPSTLLLRRSYLEIVPFNENIRYLEDFDWWLRIALLQPSVAYVDEPLMFYCLDENNRLSYTTYRKRFTKIEQLVTLWEDDIIRLRGRKSFANFKKHLITYNAIDAFVVCVRKKLFIEAFKIFATYLRSEKEFYRLIFNKAAQPKA